MPVQHYFGVWPASGGSPSDANVIDGTGSVAHNDTYDVAPGTQVTQLLSLLSPGTDYLLCWYADDGNTTVRGVDDPFTTDAAPHNVVPDDMDATATMTAPVITVTHTIIPDDMDATATMTAPTVVHPHEIVPDSMDATATVTEPIVTHTHAIVADSIDATATMTEPVVSTEHNIAVDAMDATATMTAPTVTQTHEIVPDSMDATATMTEPTIQHSTALPKAVSFNVWHQSGVDNYAIADGATEFDYSPYPLGTSRPFRLGHYFAPFNDAARFVHKDAGTTSVTGHCNVEANPIYTSPILTPGTAAVTREKTFLHAPATALGLPADVFDGDFCYQIQFYIHYLWEQIPPEGLGVVLLTDRDAPTNTAHMLYITPTEVRVNNRRAGVDNVISVTHPDLDTLTYGDRMDIRYAFAPNTQNKVWIRCDGTPSFNVASTSGQNIPGPTPGAMPDIVLGSMSPSAPDPSDAPIVIRRTRFVDAALLESEITSWPY